MKKTTELGAVALASLFGLLNRIYGFSALFDGIDLRRLQRHLGSPDVDKPRKGDRLTLITLKRWRSE